MGMRILVLILLLIGEIGNAMSLTAVRPEARYVGGGIGLLAAEVYGGFDQSDDLQMELSTGVSHLFALSDTSKEYHDDYYLSGRLKKYLSETFYLSPGITAVKRKMVFTDEADEYDRREGKKEYPLVMCADVGFGNQWRTETNFFLDIEWVGKRLCGGYYSADYSRFRALKATVGYRF